jgi:hypothetical protein
MWLSNVSVAQVRDELAQKSLNFSLFEIDMLVIYVFTC